MVKSKRAREAAESATEPSPAGVDATILDKADKKVKKRKRNTDEEAEAEPAAVADADDAAEKKKAKKAKKDKKDKKDKKGGKESRKEKKEKRKDLQDLPDEVEDADADEGAGDNDGPAKKKAKKTAKTNGDDDADAKRKQEKRDRKKEKKDNKKHEVAAAPSTNGTAPTDKSTGASSTPAATDGQDQIDLDAGAAGKQDRHIVFVGNLPFSATAASISAHFASLSPIAVRCLRNKDDPNPCRGIAFVEFGQVSHQRTCLDKFHHSTFDDGKSPSRKINVELTAGGGGKTKQRQQKIVDKNKKLDENRAKRIEREKNAKLEGGSASAAGNADRAAMEESMHPSRRAMIPGGGY